MARNDDVMVGEHRGIEIFLNKTLAKFHAKDERIAGWYESFDKVTETIDRKLAAETKLKLSGLKVELPVYTTHGQLLTIVGINRSDGTFMFKEKGEKAYDGGAVYPVLPWLEKLLGRRREVADELRKIDKQLDGLGITSRHGYYGRIDVERYEERIKALQENHATALKSAERRAPK